MQPPDNSAPVPLWTPPNVADTQMDRFRRFVNDQFSLELENYHDLYHWSITNLSEFWASVSDFVGIVYSAKWLQVIDESANITSVPEWFHGARLNFAENLLRHATSPTDPHDPERTALISVIEGDPTIRKISYRDLELHVRRLATAMRRFGIKEGDRICAYVPNCITSIVILLATASIGAIFSTTATDFGVTAVLERFDQIMPRLLFSVDAVVYKGKQHNVLSRASQIAAGLPKLEKLIIFPFLAANEPLNIDSLGPNVTLFDNFVRQHLSEDELKNPPPLLYAQLPFNYPLYILFTSGTTGKPKCLTHSAGGTLIQHRKEHVLHTDLRKNDVFFYFTSTGWMMFHWLVSGLAQGCALVLYEGSPANPTPQVLFDLIDRVGITVFGVSAKYIASMEEAGVKPRHSHNLSTLRAVLSTGSPLKPESFDYVYHDVKPDVLLGSISGGTDIISCFAGSNPTLPVYRGELQARNLGMHVESFNEYGNSIYNETGELVCVSPFPSMPIYFWGDTATKEKYHRSYFDKFPGVWSHGDYICINTATGGINIFGRSDSTLNPNGIRFGSAEIYNIVEKVEGVADSLVVGQSQGANERVILFVKMQSGHQFSRDLEIHLKSLIRDALSPRHVPELIMETPDVPYTMNMKKVEIAVKKLLRGEEPQNVSSLLNPDCLKFYRKVAQELRMR